jgi:hypothetical protein
MGSDLERLLSLSKEPHLRDLLDTLIIQDSCESLDPWSSSELPRTGYTYNIWPRDHAGMIAPSDISVPQLTMMLREGLLRPKMIRVRDYRIAQINYRLCPEMNGVRELVEGTGSVATNSTAAATLASSIIETSDLAVTHLSIQNTDAPLSEDSIIHSTRFKNGQETSVLGNPKIFEAIIELSPEHQGQMKGLSVLSSAKLQLERDATSYWLEQLSYQAAALQILTLSSKHVFGLSLIPQRVISRLFEFTLSHSAISTQDLTALLFASKETLRKIHFRQVTMVRGSRWQEFLTHLSEEYTTLISVNFEILREEDTGRSALDFREVKHEYDPQPNQLNLQVVEKGSVHNKRVTTLFYEGPDTGGVIRVIAARARPI